MAAVRRTVLFSGMVQGVFFRATAREVAERFDVSGYVRNLPDGRVELVAEGEPAELEAFINAVRRARAEYIREMEVMEGEAEGEFAGFGIRY